jgi:K+-sensing histidine kinase KdpD
MRQASILMRGDAMGGRARACGKVGRDDPWRWSIVGCTRALEALRHAVNSGRIPPLWLELLWLVLVAGLAVGAAQLCFVPGDLSTEAMVLLLGVLIISLRCRRWLALCGVVAIGAAFNFLFTEPRFTLVIHDAEAIVAYFAMLVVGAVVTTMVQRLRASSARASAREREVATERLRSTLLASVSHDLRTPLTSITGAASALLEPAGQLAEAARRDLLQGISDEAARLNELIANLLFATRLDSGDVAVRREWDDLGELAGAALRRAEPQLGARRVDIDLDPRAPLVECDPVLIEQAVFVLLDNAARHTPADAVVWVRLCCDPQWVTLEVGDAGPGVPADVAARLFQRFERGARSGGLGLGLAIAAAIARAHGGRLTHSGPGAVFRLALPRPAEQPSVPTEPTDEPTTEGAR